MLRIARLARSRLAPALLVAVLCAGFHALTLRPGHSWMDDAFLYAMHAANIAEGRPYAETCYVPNPENPFVSPLKYPPGYPAVLALVVKAGGSLEAMKLLNPLFILLLLCSLALLAPAAWGKWWTAAFVAIAGFSPGLWLQKDLVYSDLLFCALLYLAFLVRARAETFSGRFFPVILGAACYLAYAVRPVGALLPAAFLLEAAARDRASLKKMLPAVLWFALPALLQGYFFGLGDYAGVVSRSGPVRESFLAGFAGVSARFLDSLAGIWGIGINDNSLTLAAAALLALLTLGAAVFSFCVRARAWRPEAMDLFAVMYVLAVAALGIYDGPRFLLPVLPYLLLKAADQAERSGPLLRRTAGAAALAAALLYTWGYAVKADYRSAGDGPYAPPARELFSFIKSSAAPGDAVIFIKPRTMCYFTGRRSSVYPPSGDDAHFREYFSSIGARYLVVSRAFPLDARYLYGFVERNRSGLEKVFENGDYKVFRLKGPAKKS